MCLTAAQEAHLAVVIEILQSIRQSDMSPILSRIYSSPGGTEALDVLMKYMYAEHYTHTHSICTKN
jgi:actin related protein 2/3 complex subunit 5